MNVYPSIYPNWKISCLFLAHVVAVMLLCYYKGNIQDLLVIPVLSSTINHLTPPQGNFPPFFSKTLWIVVKYFLRIFGSTRYLKCTISREAYLPLWVLSTRPFKERIWDSPKNENAPHQMLWKGVSKTLYPNPGIRFSLEFQEEVILDPQWQSALPSVGTAWSCKLDLGFNGTCCWMGPMVVVVAKVVKVVHTDCLVCQGIK